MALSTHGSSRARRLDGGLALAALGWLAVLVLGTRLVRDHLDVRVDLSEDRVHSISPVAATILGRLEDVLQVELYFTQRLDDSLAQLAKRHVHDQLRALERLAAGRMELVTGDPSASAEVRLEAERYGIRPQYTASSRDSSASIQAVYLGVVLRYRGRERVIPFARPDVLEAAFLEAVQELVRPRRRVLGWWADASSTESFHLARQFLGQRFDVENVAGLAEGMAVPEHLDALVIVRPRRAHPRAVWEIHRYLERGGNVLAFLDRSDADLDTRTLATFPTGFEGYLASLGVEQPHATLFERGSPGQVLLRGPDNRPVPQPYPLFARLGPDDFDADQPVTRRLDGAEFLWAHPFRLGDVPSGVERTVLATSTAQGYLFEAPEALSFDANELRRIETELLARGEAGRQPLIVALEGRLPSPFTAGAPPARDPLGGADRERAADAATAAAQAADGRLVLVADADVIGKRGFGMASGEGGMAALAAHNRVLLDALAAWLALEPELVELRTRRPADRRIRDFLAEALEDEDLSTLERSLSRDATGATLPAESRARARATRREWTVTAAAFAGALLGVAALELVARRRRRAPLVARREVAP